MSIFQTKEYLDLYTHHFVENKTAIVNGIFEVTPDNNAVLLGMKPVLHNQEITDYGDIPNPTVETVNKHISVLRAQAISHIRFDYVRGDSQFFSTLSQLPHAILTQQEVAPYIDLPPTWEQYLESLQRTDRKELKRKWKRLETTNHNFRCIPLRQGFEGHVDTSQINAFDEFVRLHKLSTDSKNQFMSKEMELFFHDLYIMRVPSWQIKIAFLDIENKPAASVFYFENDRELLLYNSGHDSQYRYFSTGFLLCAHLIKKAIEMGKKRFDFMRGKERYKYELGGRDVRLYKCVLD